MNNIVYSIINNTEFGIKINPVIRSNILHYLDQNKNKMNVEVLDIFISNNKITNAKFNFSTFYNPIIFGYYKLSPDEKTLRISFFESDKSFIEDYRISINNKGVSTYDIRFHDEYGRECFKTDYYYEDKLITEEEANDINRSKKI